MSPTQVLIKLTNARQSTVNCIYAWTLAQKTCSQVTSNVYVSGVRLWSFPAQKWISLRRVGAPVVHSVYCHRSVAVWGKPAKITDMERRKSIEDYTWVRKLRSLTPETRSRKLKFGRANVQVWHLNIYVWRQVDMFLVRAFTGRCNRRLK